MKVLYLVLWFLFFSVALGYNFIQDFILNNNINKEDNILTTGIE